MWLFLGISAIIFTGFNLICSFKSKNEKWFRFGALRFVPYEKMEAEGYGYLLSLFRE